MKHVILLLSILFLLQTVKAEDDAVLMWGQKIDRVYAVEFSPTDPDIFALGANQGGWIRNVKTNETIHNLSGDDYGAAVSLAFSPDGQLLAYGEGYAIRIFEVYTSEQIAKIEVEDFKGASDLEFTSDGKYLIASCGYIVVINTNDWTVKHKWNEIYHDDSPPPGATERSSTRDLSIRHDNKVAACVFVPNDIAILYDIEQNQPIDTLPCSGGKVEYFNNSNKLIVNNGKLNFYDFEISNEPEVIPVYYKFCVLTENDKNLFIAADGYSIYDTETWSEKKYFKTEMKYYGMFDMIDNQYLLSARIGMYDISGLTSVTPEKESTIEISPNPANDEIRIIGLPLDIKTIDVADLKGNIVDRIEAKNTNGEFIHNVSHLPTGAYLLRINTRDDSLSVKFMIER